jgi:hypothetical protein
MKAVRWRIAPRLVRPEAIHIHLPVGAETA